MSTTSPSQNPFELSRDTLIAKLWELRIPKAYPAFPSPGHHEGVAHYLREFAAIVDAHIEVIGMHAKDNACATDMDLRCFEDVLSGAIEGNATHVLEEEAHELRDSRRVA